MVVGARTDSWQAASAVEGAHDAERAAVDDVRGEAVAERVTGRAWVDAGGRGGGANGLLERGVVQVVEHGASGRGVGARARRREDVLPREARRGGGHLRAERVREVDLAAPGGELRAVPLARGLDLRGEPLAGASGRGAPRGRGRPSRDGR